MSQYLMSAVGHKKERDKGLTTTHQGGEAYGVDAFTRARRFLILGSEGGSFYVNERALTAENIKSIGQALDSDGMRLVNMIVDISDRGLAPKNDPALLALAMAASYENPNKPDYATSIRSYALTVLPKVARTGTHLFHFAAYADSLRGWGSALRKGIGRWYTSKSPLALAQQVTKYQQRDGWSHADLLRLAHPMPNALQSAIFKYVVDGELPSERGEAAIDYLYAVEAIKHESDRTKIVALIQDYNLPREVLPTNVLNDREVWEALLYAGKGMPFTAMLRNLGNMAKVGLLEQGAAATKFVIDRLYDEDAMRKARIHPLDLLKAKLIFQSGQGLRGSGVWTPIQPVTNALEKAFYLSFGTVEPTGKNILFALDVSASMSWGEVGGVPGLTPAMATATLSLVSLKVERYAEVVGFADGIRNLGVSENDSLDSATRKVAGLTYGGTDCSLPFTYATRLKKQFDAFVVLTDNETGYVNPSKALRHYRSTSGIHDAKLVVVGMLANQFSIADPTDMNMLDVVGFDTSTPNVLSSFVRGDI